VVRLDDQYRRAKRAGVGEAELTRLLLQRYMIRREHKEVEPDLPEKIRERVEIPLGTKGKEYFDQYLHHIARADEIFFQTALVGGSQDEAKNKAVGAWPHPPRTGGCQGHRWGSGGRGRGDGQGRRVLPRVRPSHFRHGDPAGPVDREWLERRQAFDLLQPKRIEAEKLFQSGDANVYIGRLGTAVGINLNRADACIHIEQDYVPGVMLQAEARAQSGGQKAPNGYLIRPRVNAFVLPVLDDMAAGVSPASRSLERTEAGLVGPGLWRNHRNTRSVC
jgi:hypothetical protein